MLMPPCLGDHEQIYNNQKIHVGKMTRKVLNESIKLQKQCKFGEFNLRSNRTRFKHQGLLVSMLSQCEDAF